MIPMKTVMIKSNTLDLPADIVRKLGGKEVEILETVDGILLRPAGNIIKSVRGFLKGKGSFSSREFMLNKKNEKDLE